MPTMLFRSKRPRESAEDADVAGAQNGAVHDRPIGEILRRSVGLAPGQIEQVLAQQRERGGRFGEIAIATGMVQREDVLWALSQQYHYHYTPLVSEQLHEDLVMARHPFSDRTEIFRDLRSQLLLGPLGSPATRSALALVSPDEGDGRSFLAANLAIAFSQLSGRTLLVDADLRSPRLHWLFNLKNDTGLSSVLAGRSETSLIHTVPDMPSLHLLPSGPLPPNPLELVQRPAFGLLVNEMLNKFDFVIVDTPAAASRSDAQTIAAACGAALLVGRRNRTRASTLEKLVSHLDRGPVKVAGVVMNDF